MLSSRALKIASLLAASSQIALRYYSDSHPELKTDRTLVTLADRAIEKYLTEQLADDSAGIRVIGEETCEMRSREYLQQAINGKTWIVDPIDGTAMFAHRVPVWGTIIGYAENGVLQDGGIVIPGQGEMLLSDHGTTWYGQSSLPYKDWDFDSVLSPLTPPADDFSDGSLILISQKAAHNALFHCHNTLLSVCSTVYFTMLMATGRIGAAVHDAKLWDYAGCLPSLKNLGIEAVPMTSGNLMDLTVSPENYDLSFERGTPSFRIPGSFVFAPSRKTAEKVASMVTYAEDMKHV